ncbi:hypothetical protein NMG60_11017147 [Bertholletia excelsa]
MNGFPLSSRPWANAIILAALIVFCDPNEIYKTEPGECLSIHPKHVSGAIPGFLPLCPPNNKGAFEFEEDKDCRLSIPGGRRGPIVQIGNSCTF